MYVLGPLLKELVQHIGPQAQQFLSSPAFPQLLYNLTKVPPPLIGETVRQANKMPKEASDWFNSLSPEDRKKIKDAITWAGKDISGFVTKQLTSLPIDKHVSELVGTALAAVLVELETASPPLQEVTYIESRLLRGLEPGFQQAVFSPEIAKKTAVEAIEEMPKLYRILLP